MEHFGSIDKRNLATSLNDSGAKGVGFAPDEEGDVRKHRSAPCHLLMN